MSARLEVRAARFAYPDGLMAVAGVDLELAAGELVVMIGPNGAGKSTVARLCAGELAPSQGQVLLAGQPLARLAPRVRARSIAVVPQNLRALPEVRVDTFVFGGRYAHLDRWRRSSPDDERAVRQALAEADAEDLMERRLDELSGGQQQRVLIARALAQEAPLLLVDEPTSSLDPEHQLRVFGLLAALVREGRSALVVTHDFNLASQFASRIVLLDEGRVRAEGTPAEVFRPEVLGPVYGDRFFFGTLPERAERGGREAGEPRPFVLPWAARADERES